MTDFAYPTGTLIGGIAWQPNFVEVCLAVITGPLPIQNLDMHIELERDDRYPLYFFGEVGEGRRCPDRSFGLWRF